MPPMRAPRNALGVVCLLACGAFLVAGCGGGGDSEPHVNKEAEAGKSQPAPPKSAFPATQGRTLKDLVTDVAEVHLEAKITPSAEAFYPGPNRYPFLVAEKGVAGTTGKEIPDAEVAIYYAKVPSVKAQKSAFEQRAVGPFPARIETLATEPPFPGQTTTEDPDVANVVYW